MHEVSDIMFRCQKSARNLAEGTYMSPDLESVAEGFMNKGYCCAFSRQNLPHIWRKNTTDSQNLQPEMLTL